MQVSEYKRHHYFMSYKWDGGVEETHFQILVFHPVKQAQSQFSKTNKQTVWISLENSYIYTFAYSLQ